MSNNCSLCELAKTSCDNPCPTERKMRRFAPSLKINIAENKPINFKRQATNLNRMMAGIEWKNTEIIYTQDPIKMAIRDSKSKKIRYIDDNDNMVTCQDAMNFIGSPLGELISHDTQEYLKALDGSRDAEIFISGLDDELPFELDSVDMHRNTMDILMEAIKN